MSSPKLLLWLLALAPVICAFSARDLWAPDEPRYGQVAREMLESGNYLVPHVNGRPYAEKPPLYYWGAALLSKPFGRVTPAMARLAAALYTLGCILLLLRIGRTWFDDPALGLSAAALFSTTLLIGWNGSRAGLDLPLTFWILLAVERGYAYLRTRRLLPAFLCGVAWSAAVLVKGPLGFLFPPLALAAMAWGGRRTPGTRLPGPLHPGWLLMLVALVGVGLAWLLPAIDAGGDAYRERLLGQIGDRASGAEGHHLRPAWYFAVRGPLLALPWTLLYIAGAWTCLRVRRAPDAYRAPLAACAAVGVGGLLLLSGFATKREVYMVPLFPFLAVAAAYAVHHATTPRLTLHGIRLAVGISAGVGLALLGVSFAIPWTEALLPTGHAIPYELFGWSALAAYLPAALLFLVGARRGLRVRSDPVRAIWTLTPWMLTGFCWLLLVLLPHIDSWKSYGPTAERAQQVADGGPVSNVGFGQAANLLWSLDRKTTTELHTLEDVHEAFSGDAASASVVAGARWWDRMRQADPEGAAGIQEVWRNPRGKLVVLVRAP